MFMRSLSKDLILAKKSCDKDEIRTLFELILRKLSIVLEHKSWPLNEIQTAYDELHEHVVEQISTPDIEYSTQRVL